MAQSPTIGGRRIIKKSVGAKSASKRGTKQRRQESGTFQMKARRETILGPESLGSTERICTGCSAVYFDKHWHSPSFFGGKAAVRKAALAKGLCDACALRRKGSRDTSYVGEVVVTGGYTVMELGELVRAARNAGKRAQRRDPEDRILSIETVPGGVRIRTSENQLAVSIGKQLHRARKGAKLTITWSHDDKPVRVRLEK